MLAAMEKQEGRRGNKTLPQLADIGITKMQSSRWQMEAKLDEDVFDKPPITMRGRVNCPIG